MFVELRPKKSKNLSVPNTNTAPNKNPTATGTKAYWPFSPYKPEFLHISIAGSSKDQYEAAVITPAANPKDTSSNFLYKQKFQ